VTAYLIRRFGDITRDPRQHFHVHFRPVARGLSLARHRGPWPPRLASGDLSFHVFGFEASQSDSLIAVIGDWHDMTLPITCLTLLILAGYSRYMRSSALETLAQDYIKTARAKGLPERLVLFRHLVRNACLPMITLVGLSIPALLAGNLIAEFVFNYDGLGLLFFNSLGNEDYPVLIAYTLIGAVLTVLGNLIADIALTVADPRIRLS
jgi:peptide/nickel transport system permease protein